MPLIRTLMPVPHNGTSARKGFPVSRQQVHQVPEWTAEKSRKDTVHWQKRPRDS